MNIHQPFFLLQPSQLPRSREELVPSKRVKAALDLLRRASPPTPDDAARKIARAASIQLGSTNEEATLVEEDPDESEDNRTNDKLFNIVRVKGEALPLVVHATLHGFLALLEEAIDSGANLEPTEWSRLRSAFSVLFRTFSGSDHSSEDEAASGSIILQSLLPALNDRGRAMQRWVRGHRVFMVLIQGLVVTLSCFKREVEASDETHAAASLAAATHLMWGVGAALRFTGDFSYNEYETKVRPTLMPPNAPPNLSGVHWRDHECLIKLLIQLRPTFAGLDYSMRLRLCALHQAIAHAYDSHKFVCARLVGCENPSLLMLSRKDQPAIETLDRFKRSRLNLVPETKQ